jgi:hypothetical protein
LAPSSFPALSPISAPTSAHSKRVKDKLRFFESRSTLDILVVFEAACTLSSLFSANGDSGALRLHFDPLNTYNPYLLAVLSVT